MQQGAAQEETPMKRPSKILMGLIIVLALISCTGISAADDDLNAPVDGNHPAILPHCNENWWSDESDDDIPAYNGSFGPGHPLYGLKIGLEDLDEAFTFNETEKLNKQLNNARLRLSEAKRELYLNNIDTTDEALELYQDKLNATQLYMDIIPSSTNATGLLHAQEMVTKHQMVLECLLLAKPNNTGLARAYNNSLALEKKFEQKTQERIERIVEKNNKTVLKAVKLAVKEQERKENRGDNKTVSVQQTEKVKQGVGNKDLDDRNSGNGNQDNTTGSGQGTSDKGSPKNNDIGDDNQNNRNDNNGKGKNR